MWRKLEEILETLNWSKNIYQNVLDPANAEREIYHTTHLHKKRKLSIQLDNYSLQELRKRSAKESHSKQKVGNNIHKW